MFVQALESRRLFTSITYTGTLVIDGRDGDDAINVSVKGGTITVQSETWFGAGIHFPAADVKRILVLAGGGNDTVQVDHDVTKRATIVGGAGNDILVGNYAATLIGGGGNDKLMVPTRTFYDTVNKQRLTFAGTPEVPALLSGGLGDDTLVGDEKDVFVGGKGSDHGMVVLSVKPSTSGTMISVNAEDVIDIEAVNAAASGVEHQFVTVMESFNGGAASAAWLLNRGAFTLQRWRMVSSSS